MHPHIANCMHGVKEAPLRMQAVVRSWCHNTRCCQIDDNCYGNIFMAAATAQSAYASKLRVDKPAMAMMWTVVLLLLLTQCACAMAANTASATMRARTHVVRYHRRMMLATMKPPFFKNIADNYPAGAALLLSISLTLLTRSTS